MTEQMTADTSDACYLLVTRANANRDAVDYDHTGTALYALADMQEQLVEVATLLVRDAIREGMSQAEIARRMNVPASTLRGAKKEFAA